MKKVFFTLIFSFGAVFQAYGEDDRAKYAEECLSVISRPKVDVTSSYGKLRYNFERDEKFFRRETAKRFAAEGAEMPENMEPVGLTKVSDSFDFNLLLAPIEISRGYTCLYPKEIKAYLGYYVPTVYILKNLSHESCLYKVTLRHEKTHMQLYIEALDYFLPEFKKTAERLFDTVGVKIVAPNESAEEAAKALNAAYQKVMKDKVEKWREAVEAEQMKFDSPVNYLIESKLCQPEPEQGD